MGKNWGRTPVTNADDRQKTQITYLVETPDGPEERIDRRPLGKVERFVDPDGNVCSIQIRGHGDSRPLEAEQRKRADLHRKGFVEHAKCPLRTGARHSSARTSRDFAKLPADLAMECKHEIRTMKRIDGVLYADKACPHIEWLIAERVKARQKKFEIDNAQLIAQEKRNETKRKLEEAQATALVDLLSDRKPPAARKAKDIE